MIEVRTAGREAAVDEDRPEFGLMGRRQTSGLVPARPAAPGPRTRALLELHQNRGGCRFVALVGGEFVPGEGHRLAWRVRCWETVAPVPLAGLLPGTLLPGLPEELDRAATRGVQAGLESGVLPAGRLVLDRAGHDQESSPLLFAMAAEFLLHILRARSLGEPAEPLVAAWVATGRLPTSGPARTGPSSCGSAGPG
ncbi:hypothetical protein [Streptacidiphilus rugosus]|uniref:hypothetical protein n=1 Tax=Streptacidiphilus rugosus TaxID=405783 RepID=UPI000568B94C|nr:hypothetical protein [Streptacidiphilus rugosus]